MFAYIARDAIMCDKTATVQNILSSYTYRCVHLSWWKIWMESCLKNKVDNKKNTIISFWSIELWTNQKKKKKKLCQLGDTGRI